MGLGEKVTIFRGDTEQAIGLRETVFPLDPERVYWFPDVRDGMVSTEGLLWPIQVYMLDRMFRKLGGTVAGPGVRMPLLAGTRHVVEMSHAGPLLTDFTFLRTLRAGYGG